VGSADSPPLEIVGVARDGKYAQLGEEPRPFVYRPLLQSYSSGFTLVARGEGDPERLLALLRGELQRLDRRIPLSSARTLTERMSLPLLPTRLGAAVLGSLGVLALLLAAAGIYGVTSYVVSRRTREIGIRLALGADRGQVQWLLVGDGMRTTLAGIGIGALLAAGLARLVERLLFGVSATDQPTYLGVAALLTAVALVASYVPARRAARSDPAQTLRSE
jgi:ABC-type antimicrobial peptide transport system permease subunit